MQVDSVAKIWQNDSVIPANVAEAVNFYQPHGIIHGRPRIIAADPDRTAILGNYLVDYRKNPVPCPGASWADHVFIPDHMQSECDPHLWSQIETMVRRQAVICRCRSRHFFGGLRRSSIATLVPAFPIRDR